MPHHIAFLHTSPVHVATFDHLARSVDPALRVEHVVAEALLAEAQRVGAADPALVQRVQAAMVDAAAHGASLVVCTCSTIGGAAERTPTRPGGFAVARIDRAMADRAVALGPRILVVAALQSTLGPTTELIRESAIARGAAVEIQHLLVAEAWPHFLRGDHAAYRDAVAAAIRTAPPQQADAIVLAQASMAGVADALQACDAGAKVLSSPLLGVQCAVAQLRAMA